MSNQEIIKQLADRVSADRLRDLTFELVKIPSPTGDSVAVTDYYVAHMRALGFEVEVITDFPSSPSTVTRFGPRVEGRTLTMDGHLDTIHTGHVPPYVEGTRIYGRGSGDMKSGVAGMMEAARILKESGVTLGGNLTLFTHSLHEAPVGHMEALKAAVARGDIFVDAALVCEGGFDTVAVRGKGQALFEIDITREGESMHELSARPKGLPNPLDFAVRLAARILDRGQEKAQQVDNMLGPETFFLGQIHGGDFYNRLPTSAFLNGIHRYWPDKDWEDLYREFDQLIASVPRHPDLKVERRVFGNGLGWEFPADAPIVGALSAAYQAIVGHELHIIGSQGVSDVNIIAREGRIPAVSHGTGSSTGHADLEWVEVNNIVRSVKVYLATIVNYLGVK